MVVLVMESVMAVELAMQGVIWAVEVEPARVGPQLVAQMHHSPPQNEEAEHLAQPGVRWGWWEGQETQWEGWGG